MGREGVSRSLAVLAAVTVALAGCSAARPRVSEPAAPAVTAAASGPAPATVPEQTGAAALNSKLLGQVSSPTADDDLPVGPGDLIEISVFEVEELSKLKLRVPLRGAITLPLVGAVPAAGRTAIELEDEIRRRLQQRYMHDPQVSVFVHEHQSQRISVIGAVRKGGVYTVSSRLRLADALAMAEGLTDEADHVVYLIRRLPAGTVTRAQAGQQTVKASVPPLPEGTPSEQAMAAIDLEALANGREDLNVAIQAGDVIHVPRAGSFYVGGSVERPGSFFLKGKTTVEQAILAAGGVKDVADWEDVRLYRTKPGGDREVIALNIREFEKGQPAPELQKNDVVIIGKSSSRAFFFGFLDFFRGVFNLSRGF